MRYLLINHIPATAGKDGAHQSLPADWARELGAAARAANERGARLTVATPLVTTSRPGGIELVPDQLGFEFFPLPHYDSASSFLRQRKTLDAALARAISNADVVQLDAGGYPIWLGSVADPIARAHKRPTIWMLGDSLPKSTLRHSAGTVAKRLVGRSVDGRLGRSLIESLRSATRVICTSQALSDHLGTSHGVRSDCIESYDVLDREVATPPELQRRAARLLDRNTPLRFLITGELNIVGGADRVLRALHRCLRLGTACELVIGGDGIERSALAALARELQVESYVRFGALEAECDGSDVWIDPALVKSSEQRYGLRLARGMCPIVCRDSSINAPVITVAPNSVDDLAAAMLIAAINRDQLVARMLAGVEHARTRTLEASYRKRYELVASVKKDRSAA